MKRLFAIFLVICLLVPCCVSVSASEYHVFDSAHLLNDEQWQALEVRAEQLTEKYDCGVYIVTLDDFSEFCDSVEETSEFLFRQLMLGVGEEEDGILLLMSMADRDYDLDTHGSNANAVFKANRKSTMEKNFKVGFRSNDWYAGFCAYLDDCETMLKWGPKTAMAEKLTAGAIIASVILGALIAGIVCGVMKAPMKNVRMASQANEYVTKDGISITRRVDFFTHRTTVRRKIQKSSSSSSGGSGGSGHSHSSGKF